MFTPQRPWSCTTSLKRLQITAVLAQSHLSSNLAFITESGFAQPQVAPHLPPDLLAQALTAAAALTDDYSRGLALARLAPHLPPDLLAQALIAATAITSDSSRVQALAGLAPHLPADQRPSIISQTLSAAAAITDDDPRAWALEGLLPHLPRDLLAQALAVTPKTSSGPAIAVLKRARSMLAIDGEVAYLDLLRDSLIGIERKVCLTLLRPSDPRSLRSVGCAPLSNA